MKKGKSFSSSIGVITIALAIGGCTLSTTTFDPGKPTRCSQLPEGFSEEELVGTWMAGSPDQSDTLVIKADGTFKQVIHVEFVDRSPIDYESDWQPWRIEESIDHTAYLHLHGYRFCGMNPAIPCEERVGDGYDFCRDRSVKMDNEGILLILATGDREASGSEIPQFDIWLAYPLGSENSWTYALERP